MNKLKNITLQKFQINQTDREKLINQSLTLIGMDPLVQEKQQF